MNKNFLSKKSWHTGSMRHMEKVWKAEQRHDEEQKKIEQLKRELAEEERIYDLKKLQEAASGKKTDRLDWMYQVKKGPSTEEYLLGKPVTSLEAAESGLKQAQPTLWNSHEINPVMDQQAKIRDDPLLMIKQQEQSQLKSILNNPVQMKKIKQSKEMLKLMKKLKKQEKKEKKEKKKRKEMKNKASDSDSSPSSSSPPPPTSIPTDQKRDRSKSPINRDSRREHRDRNKSRSRSRSPIRNRSRSPHNKRDRSPTTKTDKYSSRRDRSRSRSKSPINRDSRRDRSMSPYQKRQKSSYRRSRSRSPVRTEYRNNRGNNNNNYKNRGSGMSEEERQRRIAQMQEDANDYEKKKLERLAKFEEEEKKESKEIVRQDRHANFIDNMNKQIYTEGKERLEDRMKRNVHYLDRSSHKNDS